MWSTSAPSSGKRHRIKFLGFDDLIKIGDFFREYMDICQEQMTELRKQKIEIGRERKRM